MSSWMIRGATVVETGKTSIESHRKDLLIEGERIAAWLEAGTSFDGEAWDATGLWVAPGLIDLRLELHQFENRPDSPSLAIQVARFADAATRGLALALRSGVTTALTTGAWDNVDLELRDWVNAGKLAGPVLLASGMAIGPYAGGSRERSRAVLEVSGPDEARRAARQQIKAGADALVVQMEWRSASASAPTRLDADELEAIAEEAGHASVWCCAVAEGDAALEICHRCGVHVAPRTGSVLGKSSEEPSEHLREVTALAARKLGRERDVGSVLPGKRADLIILEANPLVDGAALTRVRTVVQGGKVVTAIAAN